MKKYLFALIPFVFCSGLALIYSHMEPKDYPDPTYPYRTPGVLDYLSSYWFVIGIVLTALFFLFILMDDISKFLEKKKWERVLKKDRKT
jgi:hypothetical protein